MHAGLQTLTHAVIEGFQEVADMRAELKAEMREGFAGVHDRIDTVIEIAGTHHRSAIARLT